MTTRHPHAGNTPLPELARRCLHCLDLAVEPWRSGGRNEATPITITTGDWNPLVFTLERVAEETAK